MADEPHDRENQVVHLIVRSGPDTGRHFDLKPKKEALIGRATEAALRLTDPSVSYKHCLIRSAGHMVFIEDLKSRNGTIVNGEATASRALSEDGQIAIGSSVIEVTWNTPVKDAVLPKVADSLGGTLLMKRASGTTMMLRSGTPEGGTLMLGAGLSADLRSGAPSSNTLQLRAGKVVGDSLLLEIIGSGSLGVLYRGKGVKSRADVAVKVFPSAHARSPELLQGFLSETKIGLKIPNAVQTLSCGVVAENVYISMELVRGRSLRAIVDGGKKYTPAEAVEVFLPICEALHAAHVQNILHRDIKPVNLMINDAHVPVLLDLGFGKKTDSAGISIFKDDNPLDRLEYMSPELAKEEAYDKRADIYALAGTFFFALIGQAPFTAATDTKLIAEKCTEDAPLLSDLRKDVSAALASVIAKGLAKDSVSRFNDMQEFASALKAALI